MKKAPELGLTEEELDALLKVRDMLEAGCLPHTDNLKAGFLIRDIIPLEQAAGMPRKFNMDTGGCVTTCGTVACIGGWMDVALGNRLLNRNYDSSLTKYSVLYNNEGPIRELFYPDRDHAPDWGAITDSDAVKAIDNFLETGHPRYDEVMKERA